MHVLGLSGYDIYPSSNTELHIEVVRFFSSKFSLKIYIFLIISQFNLVLSLLFFKCFANSKLQTIQNILHCTDVMDDGLEKYICLSSKLEDTRTLEFRLTVQFFLRRGATKLVPVIFNDTRGGRPLVKAILFASVYIWLSIHINYQPT